MDIANVIHRVLENKQSLLELHSADGASFYITYLKYVFEKIQVSNNAASRSYTKFIFATRWQNSVTSLKSDP